jgi:hypothetical protein
MRVLSVLLAVGLFLSTINIASGADSTPPGSGRCARRDFSSTSAPGAYGSAGSDITFTGSLSGIRGAEIDNNTSSDLYLSLSTSATNCSAGTDNVAVPANSSRFLNQSDQRFGSHICARRQDGSSLSAGTLTICVR